MAASFAKATIAGELNPKTGSLIRLRNSGCASSRPRTAETSLRQKASCRRCSVGSSIRHYRPWGDRQMLQPAELKSDQPLTWSSGRGSDVWTLFQACAGGDLQTVRALIAKDASLVRS